MFKVLRNLLIAALAVTSFAQINPRPPAGISDAPSDGNQYARKNAAWAIVSASNSFVVVPQGTTAGTVDYTGATDSSAHLQAICDANPRTMIYLLVGTPKFNVKIKTDGTILVGAGMDHLSGAAVSYWQPYTVTSPVVQIGDDTAVINGAGVTNALIYTPSGTGVKGLVFAGGAQKCVAYNVMSLGFTTSCFEWRNDDNNPCTFNLANNLVANTNVVGAAGFYFYDPHSAFTGTASFATNVMTVTVASTGTVAIGAPVTGAGVPANTYVVSYGTGTGGTGTYNLSTSPGTIAAEAVTLGGSGWTTANEIVNFNTTAPNGYPVLCEGAQTNSMTNGYIQTSYSTHGVYFRKRHGWLYTPRLNFIGVDVDNVAGNFTASTVFDEDAGSNYRSAANVANLGCIEGQLNTAAGAFWCASHTTLSGTFAPAATTCSVTSATGMEAGMAIVIPGAGASGRNYVDYIASISGTTITLKNHNSGTSVGSGTDFMLGDYVPTVHSSGVLTSWMNQAIIIGGSNKVGVTGDSAGRIWQSNVDGNYYWNMYDKPIRFLGKANSPTVTAITRSGTTVTVTTSGAHNASVGDYFTLSGITDSDGFNTTPSFAPTVVSVADTTHFTYTSGVSGAATPAQTPTLTIYKGFQFNNGRLEIDNGSSTSNSGIGLRKADGTFATVLRQDNTTADTYFKAADYTNGVFNFRIGSSVGGSTTKAFRLGSDSVGDYNYFLGNGNFWLKKSAAPSVDSGGCFIYADASGLLHSFDANSVDTLLSQEKTITGAGTTGNQTINKSIGSVRFAAGAGTAGLTVTNSLCATTSVILCTVGSHDSTLTSVQAVAGSGSFIIYGNANATAECIVYFEVKN